MRRVWIWCCLVTMLLTGAGCGASSEAGKGPSAPASSAYGGRGYAPDAVSQTEASVTGGEDSSPTPPATAMMAPPSPGSSTSSGSSAGGGATADRSSREPSPSPAAPPRERPGLGTEWGETRVSHVHDVSFVRADQDRPFAVAQMFYNDRRGVDALAAYHANRSVVRDFSAAGGAITVSIIGTDGEPLEGFNTGERSYVVGEQGQRYSIAITNHTGHRFETIATVDGLDVINGRQGTLSNRGYVLMPFATLEIDGFRQSQDAVAAFRFAHVSESYAAQTGSARNVGVIGVAFFSERGDTMSPYDGRELRTRDTASPFPGADPRFARPPR